MNVEVYLDITFGNSTPRVVTELASLAGFGDAQ